MQLKSLCSLVLFTVTLSFSQVPTEGGCPALSKDIKERVESYLAHRLVSGTSVHPSVKSVDPLPDGCYKKVTMNIPGTTGDVVMYLSPDERFLTSTLYDLSVDPQKEVARIATNVTKLLMRDNSPRFGDSASHITLVEFVDFQCPYCKRFADWYSNLPASLRSQTALVFKNLPLPQHPWARSAASYAVCANLQSSSAFRELTNFLFQRQSELTLENFKDLLTSGLKQSKVLDLQKMEACVSSQEPSQIVDRDLAIAKQLNVNNTPTLFIDGRRVLRVTSMEELQHLLETELENTDSIRAQINQFSAAH